LQSQSQIDNKTRFVPPLDGPPLSLQFADELKTPDIEFKIAVLERRLHHLHPAVIAVFVKPQSAGGFNDAIGRRYGHLEK